MSSIEQSLPLSPAPSVRPFDTVIGALRRAAVRSAAILVVLITWEVLPRLHLVEPAFLPPLSVVLATGWELVRSGELLAHIEVLARRSSPAEAATTFEVGGLALDRLSRKVERDGEAILLQPREFRLLEYLMKNAGKVVTRTMLLENVWDYHFDPQTNVIDVHVSRLRSKIEKDFDVPLLRTVRGAGYMIKDDRASA